MNPLFHNICIIFIDLVCLVNKGQAAWFGLAWLPVVCENRLFSLAVFLGQKKLAVSNN